MRKIMCGILTLGVALALSAPAWADRGEYHERGLRLHRSHWGSHITVLPRHHMSVWVGRAKYYYFDGVYYTGAGVNYVVVPPPIGAVVTAVPGDYRPVMINGVTYYVNDGVYYVNNGYGYQVVPQPAPYPQAEAQVAPAAVPAAAAATSTAPAASEAGPAEPQAPAAQPDAGNEFTVNIPNDKGGYTPVVIKKSDKGYIGPQGELYTDFPKVEQLKAMYAK